MTHNVFGLDHALIMNRLLATRKRSKDAWSSLDDDTSVISYRAEASKLPDVDTGTQKQELADFLLKRQVNNILFCVFSLLIQHVVYCIRIKGVNYEVFRQRHSHMSRYLTCCYFLFLFFEKITLTAASYLDIILTPHYYVMVSFGSYKQKK